MFFSVITKNLVTFKRWDEIKDEKLYYYGGSLKNPTFRERIHEKPIHAGELSKKRGGLGQFADLKGGLGKKRGGVFERGVDTPMKTMFPLYIVF